MDLLCLPAGLSCRGGTALFELICLRRSESSRVTVVLSLGGSFPVSFRSDSTGASTSSKSGAAAHSMVTREALFAYYRSPLLAAGIFFSVLNAVPGNIYKGRVDGTKKCGCF